MRKKPYTQVGIMGRKCFRCGAPAKTQWQVCIDGNQYRPLCVECDVGLNVMVMQWCGIPLSDAQIKEYREKIERG